MGEEILLRVNGRTVSAPMGSVVAAAVARADETGFRRSVSGQARGPLCGMGVCMECRVTIDGETQRRSCQVLCAKGMEVWTDEGRQEAAGRWETKTDAGDEDGHGQREADRGTKAAGGRPIAGGRLEPAAATQEVAYEVVVVGAGPAGLAAATMAAENGRRVLLVDETPWLGGQIWRGEQAHPATPLAGRWLERFVRSGASVAGETGIVACPKPGTLIGETPEGAREIRYEKLVLGTGARELFLPFPGWTLPGVLGPGGLLSLSKHGWPVAGKRVVVAGSGPLLLAAADGLAKYGAHVAVVAEQAEWARVIRFGVGLVEQPAKIWQGLGIKRRLRGVPYRTGTWVTKAEGDGKLASVILTDGKRTWTEAADLLACGFGLVPNLELAMTLGCGIAAGRVSVDEWQQTSVPGIYCAGEGIGVGGADAALVDGQIAGLAAAGGHGAARAFFRRRAAWKRFRRRLREAFTLRPELRRLATDETTVCRCEDVTLGRLKAYEGWRDAKLHARCGMGACQGRVCGAAAKFLLGWETGSARPPVLPARIGSLIFQPTKEETNL